MRAFGLYLAVPCLLALLLLSGGEAAAVEAGARAGRLGATVAYYSAMLATLAIFAAITFAVKQYIWTLYAGLGAVTLSWPALHDQALTQVFVPGLEIPFGAVIAAAFVIAALSFATAAHATARGHPLARLRPVLWACAALSLLAVPLVQLLPDGAAIVLMRSVQLASLLCHVIPVSTFTHLDGEDDRFARNGAILVALLLAGASVLALGGAIDFEANRFLFERATVALGVVFGSVLSFRHVIAVSRGREHALEEALAASERDAATSRALLEAERNYSRARDLAHRHRDRLAHAAHDVLQPLMSLRRTVDDVTRDGPADLREDVGNAFDYLEEIAARMDPGDAEASHRQQRPDDHPAATPERVPVQVFLDTLDRMFRAEAEEKGIGFAIAASEAETTADAFAIMRVMSNLLSNAVRHTPSGAVDVRVGREGASLLLCVENSGQPLLPEDIARLSQAREKGEDSTGKGLGLAIAFGIAREQGWELSFEPVPGEVQRNRFTLAVPAARGQGELR